MAEININTLPKELTAGRDASEGAFIMSIYNNPSLYEDYCNKIKSGEDIITPSGIFYYNLFLGMKKAGYEVFDNISIEEFISTRPKVNALFESYGGFQVLQTMRDQVNGTNFDTHYNNLIKLNMLIQYHLNGINIVDEFSKYIQMSTDELTAYWESKIENVAALNDGGVIEGKNLSTGYSAFFEKWDKGNEIGFPIALPGVNYLFMGIHKKNLMLHLANIGIGKTTSAIAWYIIPALKNGENVTIIANEQDESEWRQMIIATVLFGEIGNINNFNRHNLRKGHYTDENKSDLKKAEEWLESQKGKITFVETQDYGIDGVKKIIKKYSKLGCALFVFDVLKPFDDASDKAWAEFAETAKGLFLLAKQLDVAVIATCQLSAEAMRRNYLDLTCIGKSKAIAETASNVLMFRPLTKTEKSTIKPWKFDEIDHRIRITIDLDESKDYIAVFFPKNRYGETYPELVVERNMSFNTYKQIGWYEFPRDVYKKV